MARKGWSDAARASALAKRRAKARIGTPAQRLKLAREIRMIRGFARATGIRTQSHMKFAAASSAKIKSMRSRYGIAKRTRRGI